VRSRPRPYDNPMPLPTQLDYPVIAVGDLHGQLGFLDRLLAKLRTHEVWPTARLVFLGDLVDRGRDVKGTVQRVMDLLAEKPGSTCVMGNHDFALANAAGLLGERPVFWTDKYRDSYDHVPTFRSYTGFGPVYSTDDEWLRELDDLREAMPESHREFLRGLPWLAEASGHLFLHNGLSAELNEPAEIQLHALRMRRWADVMTPKLGTKSAEKWQPSYPAWFGADKLANVNPLPVPGRVQVVGHVKVDAPEVNAIRIRLDTSGGVAEPLTAAVLRSASAPPEFVTSNG
jgi:serine/threonine protein phosphatase 1